MSIEGNIFVVEAILTAKILILCGWARGDAVAEVAHAYRLTDDERSEVLDYFKKYGAV